MRYALLLCLLLGGCTAAPVLTVQDRAGLGAYLAFQVVANNPPAPAPPTPSPDNSKICDECNGQGWVGDGTIKMPCPNPDCPFVSEFKASQKPKVSQKPRTMPRTMASGPHWNVNGNWNYTTLELADHLRREHGVNINGLTRSQLERIHDDLHNGKSIKSSTRSTRSCPTGNCPLR